MRRSFVAEALTLFATTTPDSRRLLYDHAFHAGNYADVVKHTVLIQLLRRMQRKSSPMTYVETHAGAGAYPLRSPQSRTLAEHEQGIALLERGARSTTGEEGAARVEPSADQLLALMERLSEDSDEGLVYPGSPVVASSLCREEDSLLFCEKEPGPFERLRRVLGDDKRVTLLNDNGYATMLLC